MPQRFNSFFNSVEGNEAERCHYPTRLDTYGCGCQHNCAYCYARSLLDFREMWNPAQPAVADPKEIRKVIARKLRPGQVVRLGGMTDCFQPFERARKNTYRTIQWLNQRKVHYLIVTKNNLVAEYTDVLDKSLAHIQVSITSTKDDISKKIEPGAPLPEERIKAVEHLFSLGYDVQVRLSPYIPAFVDVDRINGINCDKILVEFLRVNPFIKRWLTNLGVKLDGYTLHSAGYEHLPLTKKKELISKINFKEISVCEDVPEHWDYWQKNLNHNPNDCCNLTF